MANHIRHVMKRRCLKMALIFGGIVAFSRYGVQNNSAILNQKRDDQTTQKTTNLEDDTVTRSSHVETDTAQTPSTNRTPRQVEYLMQTFVIDRISRSKTGGSPGVVYTLENTPGYFRRRNWHWTLTRLGQYSSDVYTVPTDEVPEQRLPTVFILGVSGCGLDRLLEYLSMHPQVAAVAPDIRYFDQGENLLRGMDWYKSEMPLTFTNQITIEKNPSYFWDRRAPQKISKMNALVKFILVLGDPVERILSSREIREKIFTLIDGVLTVNTNSWIVTSGIIVKFIKPWLRLFPLSQVGKSPVAAKRGKGWVGICYKCSFIS